MKEITFSGKKPIAHFNCAVCGTAWDSNEWEYVEYGYHDLCPVCGKTCKSSSIDK